MKIQLAHAPFTDYITYVVFDRGYYKVNWSTGKVEFSKGKPKMENMKSKKTFLDFKKLTPIEGENASKTICMEVETSHYRYTLDYIEGDVSIHSHPSGVEEVYLSAEPEFKGEFCWRGDKHQTFSRKTFGLKRFHKEN